MTFSIIIPTFNAAKTIHKTLVSVQRAFPHSEIIVIDGTSTDQTAHIVKKQGVHFYVSERGRGIQMNVGAKKASGETLLFLHADTTLPTDAKHVLQKYFQQRHVQIGSFAMRFDRPHIMLKLYSLFTRFDSLWTRFGDQCIVVRKSFFDKLGGYPNWKIFEDVCFLQNARRQTRIYSFPSYVVTSSDKYVQKGYLIQQLKNAHLVSQYLRGVSPDVLFKKYYT